MYHTKAQAYNKKFKNNVNMASETKRGQQEIRLNYSNQLRRKNYEKLIERKQTIENSTSFQFEARGNILKTMPQLKTNIQRHF